MTIETPAYTVERRDGPVEIRSYQGYILAQVDVKADYDEALSIGFRTLAHYIIGHNRKRSDIAMTEPVSEELISSPEKIPRAAPVTREIAGDRLYRISFTMPSQYTLQTLPEPEDRTIQFREVKNRRFAALRFSGRVNEHLEQEKTDELKKWLAANGIKPRSNFIVAQYDHPAIPGFVRRNEIIVDI